MTRPGEASARLALVVVSLAVALGIGEVAFRLAAWKPPRSQAELDERLERSQRSGERGEWGGLSGTVQPGSVPGLPYELRPGLSGRFHGQPIATNAWGMRSGEVERDKPDGVFRIVGLGDSHMFGWGVAQDELYLARLEERLNEAAPPGRRFEVLNCAVPGYNTVLEATQLEARCAAFAPDLVVLHVVGNDLDLPRFLELERRPPRSYLFAAVAGILVGGEAGDGEGGSPPAEEPSSDPRPARLAGQRAEARRRWGHLAGAEAARSAFERIAARLSAMGASGIAVSMGDSGPARELLLPLARSKGWTVIDAWPASLAELERLGLGTDDRTWRQRFRVKGRDHPSVEAHRLFADLLLAELERQGVAGGAASTAP